MGSFGFVALNVFAALLVTGVATAAEVARRSSRTSYDDDDHALTSTPTAPSASRPPPSRYCTIPRMQVSLRLLRGHFGGFPVSLLFRTLRSLA